MYNVQISYLLKCSLDFDHSRLLEVKSDCAVGLPKHDFLLEFNCKIWPNSASIWDGSLQNLSDLDFRFSRLLKVKYDEGLQLDSTYMTSY